MSAETPLFLMVDFERKKMMTRIVRMEDALTQALRPTHLVLKDESHLHAGHAGASDPRGETHIFLEIASPQLENLTRVEAHRRIHEILKEEFDQGLHALRIKILLA